jgi:hypothetical protein
MEKLKKSSKEKKSDELRGDGKITGDTGRDESSCDHLRRVDKRRDEMR